MSRDTFQIPLHASDENRNVSPDEERRYRGCSPTVREVVSPGQVQLTDWKLIELSKPPLELSRTPALTTETETDPEKLRDGETGGKRWRNRVKEIEVKSEVEVRSRGKD